MPAASLEQDEFDRIAADVVTDIVQSAPDPRVAPAAVLARHSQHELTVLGCSTRAHYPAATAAIVLRRDQPTVPTQRRLRRDQRVNARQRLAAELLCGECKPTPLGVRVSDPTAAQLFSRSTRFSTRRYSGTRR